jgi:hypothetical protein
MIYKYINIIIGAFMGGKKIRFCFVSWVVGVLLFSCATGNYMSLKDNEQVEILGTVQTTFTVTGSFRYRSVINTQAYINLLAEAQTKYPNVIVDVRDIVWAIGQGDAANNNYVYTATGKVIKK